VTRGRFAPSPTGDLHLGGAYVAVAARLRAQSYVVRMEDLDRPRVVPGAADRILDDLEWLGVEWDEGPRIGGPYAPYEQSARNRLYSEAIAALEAKGLVYPCTCSRAEIARVASAPHAGEEGPRYPGTCRNAKNRRGDRPVSIRLRVPDDDRRIVEFDDVFAGRVREDVGESVGDFVLRRADGVASYQLAVVVDDLEMKIDEVLRGDDLLSSTARQILIARLLDRSPPCYAHVLMVLGPDGERLAKRHQSGWRGSTIAELRAGGVPREDVLGEIGAALGVLPTPRAIAMHELIAAALENKMDPRSSWRVPERWVVKR
jgi:glutamyl-tRNA synthetase